MILDQFFEQIKKQFDDKLPFVAYRKPNGSELKGMLQRDGALHSIADFTESGFVFAHFDSRNDAFLIPFEHSELLSVQLDKNDISKDEIGFQKSISDINNPNQEAAKLFHINNVEKAIEAIKSGSFSKVVFSRQEIIENVDNNPIEIFKRLLLRYPTAFVYVWFHPKVGLWLGATPETLLTVRGNQLKTMALAGTQAFEGSMDVVWKEKEKEEQQIVTDFIVENLRESVGSSQSTVSSLQPTLTEKERSGGSAFRSSDTSDENIKISGPKTVRAGNLLHLETEISIQLKPETSALKPILNALHPTPAVCGYPKEKAKAYILENEGYDREFYSGFMGELHLKENISRNPNRRNVENNAYNIQKSVSNLYVNLRCMQIKDQNIIIYVGGGITKHSDPVSEWEETIHKSQIIKSVL